MEQKNLHLVENISFTKRKEVMETNTEYHRGQYVFLNALLEIGAVTLSPFHINLNTVDDPMTPGRLTQDEVDLGSHLLCCIQLANGSPFDAVSNVPQKGDKFARVLSRISGKPLIPLKIELINRRRRIAPLEKTPDFSIKKVLVIGNVTADGYSECEAVQALRNYGIVVDDVVIIVDREEGGAEKLAMMTPRCKLHPVFNLSELRGFYLDADMLVSREPKAARKKLALQA